MKLIIVLSATNFLKISLMKDQFITFIETNNLFCKSQCGFRNKNIRRNLEFKLETYATFLNLTKALDWISSEILLKKLAYYNFHPNSTNLIKSYLQDRYQHVQFKNNLSEGN